METNKYLVAYWQIADDEWIDREQYIYAANEDEAKKCMLSVNPLARNITLSLCK
jgi:hypothetical protein